VSWSVQFVARYSFVLINSRCVSVTFVVHSDCVPFIPFVIYVTVAFCCCSVAFVGLPLVVALRFRCFFDCRSRCLPSSFPFAFVLHHSTFGLLLCPLLYVICPERFAVCVTFYCVCPVTRVALSLLRLFALLLLRCDFFPFCLRFVAFPFTFCCRFVSRSFCCRVVGACGCVCLFCVCRAPVTQCVAFSVTGCLLISFVCCVVALVVFTFVPFVVARFHFTLRALFTLSRCTFVALFWLLFRFTSLFAHFRLIVTFMPAPFVLRSQRGLRVSRSPHFAFATSVDCYSMRVHPVACVCCLPHIPRFVV